MNLTGGEIDGVLSRHADIKHVFMGCVPCDRIPTRDRYPYALVVNTDVSKGAGEHWVVIYATSPTVVEYFDSLAKEPIPSIKEYLETFRTVIENPKPLQDKLSEVCGAYCMYFVAMRVQGRSLTEICNYLRSRKCSDDYVASFFFQ